MKEKLRRQLETECGNEENDEVATFVESMGLKVQGTGEVGAQDETQVQAETETETETDAKGETTNGNNDTEKNAANGYKSKSEFDAELRHHASHYIKQEVID